MKYSEKVIRETEDNSMTDNTNKGFWERMARIYTAFMSKNDTAYGQICKLSEHYIDSEKSVLELEYFYWLCLGY